MKKAGIWGLIITIIVLIPVGLGFNWYHSNYGTTAYYTQITTKGERKTGKDDSGKAYVYYHYSQPGYSDNGAKKALSFDSVLPRSLKMGAYLKVGYNDKRQQVINWEKVNHKDVPKAALNKID
ncbi:YxeA family protein [Lactiplantibacillus sp. DA1]|uniref:YxeA family protein n=1 Tax=Lactiplantibacillus sp. DA1 TaxID=3079857 RepID=UPI00292A616A|nr:YxeA family protein [Lactiplantibacillus sp. DA1]MDV0430505.1 YxeA family protein [Lactiplantibacillus sp. DA1]